MRRQKKCQIKERAMETRDTYGISNQITTKLLPNSGIIFSETRHIKIDENGVERCSCGGYIWRLKYPDGRIRIVCGDCGYDRFE